MRPFLCGPAKLPSRMDSHSGKTQFGSRVRFCGKQRPVGMGVRTDQPGATQLKIVAGIDQSNAGGARGRKLHR